MRVILLYLVHPWDRLLGFFLRGRWRLLGYDTFAGEWYPILGRYLTEAAARRAGLLELRRLERQQPTAASGGQAPGGIQDRVYLAAPDGTTRRLLPPD